MNTLLIILWLLIGLASFIYWYTKDHDLTIGILLFSIIISLMGPITFMIGYLIHGGNGDSIMDTVLFKKRD